MATDFPLLVEPDELAKLLSIDPDHEGLDQVCQAASDALTSWLRRFDWQLDEDSGEWEWLPVDHSTHSADREAAGTMAVNIWTSRGAPGGQVVGLDLAPIVTPYTLARLRSQVKGLVQQCLPGGGVVVG